jgi:hypothetical protein
MVTADLRPPPDFLVIGTKRGGTTSMSSWLFAHPGVTPLFPARLAPKGVRYLDEHADRHDRWYRSHFATVLTRGSVFHPRRLAGEVTANYLFCPGSAARAAAAAPDARIVVLLRDPVERAWSHYRERVRRGAERLGFAEALRAEEDRLAEDRERRERDPRGPFTTANVAYRGQGVYADLLPPWFERFGIEGVLVLMSAEVFADPAMGFERVCSFLGLARHDLVTYAIRAAAPGAEPALPIEIREELRAFYEPYDLRLEQMLGRNLPWRS